MLDRAYRPRLSLGKLPPWMVEMPDNTKTVMLTEREIDLVLQCIGTNIETVKRRHPVTGSTADLVQELAEMDMDIREQVFRGDSDGWNTDDSSTLVAAEDDFIQQGMDAAEQAKINRIATANRGPTNCVGSRAQERRTFNMQRSRDSRQPSETQTHDVWDDNDPKNW